MHVLKNISILYTCRMEGNQESLHPVENAAIAWCDGMFEWVGKESELPKKYDTADTIDANGKIVIPGLVDCHTHLCFGGWRPDEFEMRTRGESYLDIAKAGGGILSTVKSTRKASFNELYEKAASLLQKMIRIGITTVECKSGYGLRFQDEIKQLNVYKKLQENFAVEIIPTFLGAHTIPPEFKGNRQGYIDLIIHEMIPYIAAEKLARFCDIFVEESAFTVDEARIILETAKEHGLIPKLHADQLSDGGGAELAAELGAISADHLEKVSDTGLQKMAENNVTAVTLPLASLYTQQPYLNCRRLLNFGVDVAVATDFNPGSAPSFDIHLAMMLTCNHGRLTPSETLKAATIYSAKAIKAEEKTGSIEPGKKADFILLNAPDINFWLYHFGGSKIESVYVKGVKVES